MRRTTPLGWLVITAALVTLAAAPLPASARAWLGVYSQAVTDELRDALDLKGDGVLVSRVVPDSPADRAGLRKGDVITRVDRKVVGSPGELSDLIGENESGESVSLSINRHGEDLILAVRLGDRPQDDGEMNEMPTPPAPPEAPMAPRAPKAPRAPEAPRAPREMRWYSSKDGDVDIDPGEIRDRIREVMPDLEQLGPGKHGIFMGGGGRGRLGVRIETLSSDLASALGATGAKGALVLEVLDGTPAEKAGLRAGDIITAVGGTTVADGDDLVKALGDEDGKTSLSIVRRGEKRTVEAELEAGPRVIRLRDGLLDRKLGRGDEPQKFKIKLKGDEGDDDDLRQQLQELREQLRQLREELRNRR